MYKRAIFRLQSWGYLFKKSTLKNKYVIFNLGQTKSIVAINKKRSNLSIALLCHIVPNHRTFIEDYLKILDFIDWLKVAYPEKAKFLTEKS